MIDKVEERIDHWFNPSVKRIIFHISASRDPGFVIERCHKNKTEAGIAIAPDRSIAQALAYKKGGFFPNFGREAKACHGQKNGRKHF